MPLPRYVRVVPLLVALLPLTSLACQDEKVTSRAKAHEIWRQHERIVESAARGERVDLPQFLQACRFFEGLTGIAVPGDHSFDLYWYPTKDTAKAVEPLHQWFAANKDRMYWDEASKTVKLRPLHKRPRELEP